MAKFKEYQCVRVARLFSSKVWIEGTDSVKRSPKAGDEGVVVDIYTDPTEGYCVECVQQDGKTVWLADFTPDELDPI